MKGSWPVYRTMKALAQEPVLAQELSELEWCRSLGAGAGAGAGVSVGAPPLAGAVCIFAFRACGKQTQ